MLIFNFTTRIICRFPSDNLQSALYHKVQGHHNRQEIHYDGEPRGVGFAQAVHKAYLLAGFHKHD